MHDARTIANRFLALADQAGDSLTPMQLLKLVYMAHGWNLGLNGRPLISDKVQAWQYGPVIRPLYEAIRSFKSQPVSGPISAPAQDRLSADDLSLIDEVYELYGDLSGPALSRLTHARGTPWDMTYEPGEFGTVIPNDLIEDHYKRLSVG